MKGEVTPFKNFVGDNFGGYFLLQPSHICLTCVPGCGASPGRWDEACWLALADYGGHWGTCVQGIPAGSCGWGEGKSGLLQQGESGLVVAWRLGLSLSLQLQG